jgi:dTDP-4-amino-4,6-dideoxygalactose transaminase
MNDQKKVEVTTIPHSKPTLGEEESRAVSEVIGSGYVAEGKLVRSFENALADRIGVEYAVSTNSGTAALHLTLLAMGVGPGDGVIIPSFVCSALLNAVNYTGAIPVLAEIDPVTFNLDASDVEKRINKSTKAIIVPHLFGLAADMDHFRRFDVPIIEDCAQSIGAQYDQRPVGSFGDAAVFSFYATKVITTAEGGMVVTSSGNIADSVRDLKNYDERDEYKLRFNYKMSNIQAALGLVQLDRLDSIVKRRREIADEYSRAFSRLDLLLPPDDTGHIYFRYVIGVKMDSTLWIQSLSRMGVACARPIHLPLHRYLNLEGFPQTDRAWEQAISIPIYPTLSDEEVSRVIESVITCHDQFHKSK